MRITHCTLLSVAMATLSSSVMAQPLEGQLGAYVEVVNNSGTLCPEKLHASSSDAAVTIFGPNHSTNQASTLTCVIEAKLYVAAGWKFREPRMCNSVRATNVADIDPQTGEQPPQPASRLNVTYKFGSQDNPFSQEGVGDPLIPGTEDDQEFILCHNTNLTTPECTDPSRPTEVPFWIEIEATIQPYTDFQLNTLDGEFWFTPQVDWAECGKGFDNNS